MLNTISSWNIYFLKPPFEELKFLLKFMLNKKGEKVDFKKNRDLMLFHILLQENAFSSIDSFIHIFNKEDETIRFLTAMYYVKSGKNKAAMGLLTAFHEMWAKPYFIPYIRYSKVIFKELKEKFRFHRIWELLANKTFRDDREYWYELFLDFAGEKLKEEFTEKGKLDKGLKNLVSRLDRYELAKGKKDTDLNSDLLIKVYQLYFFMEGDYKECQKIAKKNEEIGGLLFSKDFYSEISKKKVDKKKVMKTVAEDIRLDEIPYFFDFLEELGIPELAKMRIMDAELKDLTEHHSRILYSLMKKGLADTNERAMEIIGLSRSCKAELLLRSGDYKAAYEAVMNMNYLEFTSPDNCRFVMETLRVNEDYKGTPCFQYGIILL